MIRSSLRLKYALLVNGLIVLPMAAYLAWDLKLERQSNVDGRVEVLRSMGQLVAEQAACDIPECAASEGWLERFHDERPDTEIYVFDRDLRVIASTESGQLGAVWTEPDLVDVANGRRDFAWEFDQHGDLPVLEISLPVYGGVPAAGGTGAVLLGAVHIAEPQATLQSALRRSRTRSVTFVALLLALTGATVVVVTERTILRRIQRLTARVRSTRWHAARGGAPPAGDELDTLHQSFETLLDEVERVTGELQRALDDRQALLGRVEGFNEELAAQVAATRRELEQVQREMLRKERLSAMGELAAGLAHEVRNPLQIIQGTAEAIRRRHPEAGDALADVIAEVQRLEQLVHQLLDYSRPLEPGLEVVALPRLVDSALSEIGPLPPGVAVVRDEPPDATIWCDEGLLRRVLVNLLANATEALEGGGGTVTVRAGRDAPGGSWIEIEDDGPGIAEADLGQVFEPFFSRKEAGTGLGLCLSRRLVGLHDGSIDLRSELGRGTIMRIELPAGAGI